jgi:hypothetical protein
MSKGGHDHGSSEVKGTLLYGGAPLCIICASGTTPTLLDVLSGSVNVCSPSTVALWQAAEIELRVFLLGDHLFRPSTCLPRLRLDIGHRLIRWLEQLVRHLRPCMTFLNCSARYLGKGNEGTLVGLEAHPKAQTRWHSACPS